MVVDLLQHCLALFERPPGRRYNIVIAARTQTHIVMQTEVDTGLLVDVARKHVLLGAVQKYVRLLGEKDGARVLQFGMDFTCKCSLPYRRSRKTKHMRGGRDENKWLHLWGGGRRRTKLQL